MSIYNAHDIRFFSLFVQKQSLKAKQNIEGLGPHPLPEYFLYSRHRRRALHRAKRVSRLVSETYEQKHTLSYYYSWGKHTRVYQVKSTPRFERTKVYNNIRNTKCQQVLMMVLNYFTGTLYCAVRGERFFVNGGVHGFRMDKFG